MLSEFTCEPCTYRSKTTTMSNREYSVTDLYSICNSIALPYIRSINIEETINLSRRYFLDSFEHSSADLLIKSLLGENNDKVLSQAFQYHFIDNDFKRIKYEEIQAALGKINEKQDSRKDNGVYYTPADVVYFITSNCIRASYGLINGDNLSSTDYGGVPIRSFCLEKTVLEPTCGTGEFLLAALEIKLSLWEGSGYAFEACTLRQIVATLHGNDINTESTTIAKIRLFLAVLRKCGLELACGIIDVFDMMFTNYDFIDLPESFDSKFDIILGNPPYVEDHKYSNILGEKYGNIYCNVLNNSSKHLTDKGVIGFIIPLSYVSTPRMKKIRDRLYSVLPKQFIFNFADRPDCLFTCVHQKLSILIGCPGEKKITYTSNYQYWYRSERSKLFERLSIVKNEFHRDDCILKLGTSNDKNIYKKVTDKSRCVSVYENSRVGSESVYINRRETFWIKAFRTPINHPEFKVFSYKTHEEADYCYCLVNSSLFWWYWICTSDCWHVSKSLNDFMAPVISNFGTVSKLADALATKLEATKVYVGTKQTEYEYKHNACIDEIHAIDDYVNGLYGLSEEESDYIKNFAYRYRISGGAEAK